MQIRTIALMALFGLGLSGCSFWKKSDSADVSAQADTSLRSTPEQAFQFSDQTYDVEIYDSATRFAGYSVELYNTAPVYSPVTYSDPRKAEFVKLNGDSETLDWQNCETINRGYLFISEYDFSLEPGFEVCMRNKGYVLSTEYGVLDKQTLSAQNSGLRRAFPQAALSPSYANPNSAYPSFYP